MAFNPLSGSTGWLVVGTTPVRITANLVGTSIRGKTFNAGDPYAANSVFVQQQKDNTGYLYLCRANGNITSGVDLLDTLIPPTISGSFVGLAWLAFCLPYAPGGLNASDYYLVSDVAAQKALVSALVG